MKDHILGFVNRPTGKPRVLCGNYYEERGPKIPQGSTWHLYDQLAGLSLPAGFLKALTHHKCRNHPRTSTIVFVSLTPTWLHCYLHLVFAQPCANLQLLYS